MCEAGANVRATSCGCKKATAFSTLNYPRQRGTFEFSNCRAHQSWRINISKQFRRECKSCVSRLCCGSTCLHGVANKQNTRIAQNFRMQIKWKCSRIACFHIFCLHRRRIKGIFCSRLASSEPLFGLNFFSICLPWQCAMKSLSSYRTRLLVAFYLVASTYSGFQQRSACTRLLTKLFSSSTALTPLPFGPKTSLHPFDCSR